MKNYIHSRIGPEERALLEELRRGTGESESALVKKGLRLIYEREVKSKRSALEVAGKSVGRFRSKWRDLSSNKKHLKGFGR